MIKVIKWPVIKWKQLWRTIWYPTVNLKYSGAKVDDATYKINLLIDGVVYTWAWVYRKKIKLFEWYIFDFDEEIYWKEIEIIVLNKIRENRKVKSLEELKPLIKKDIKLIKKIKNNILTFWTFDHVHEWHINFLNQAKKFWDKLITIVATDKNVVKFKWQKPKYKLEKRIKHVKKLKISKDVFSWDETSPLECIHKYNPKVVCLWYDQVWFSKELKKYIKKNHLDTEVVRMKPYKEKKYKSSLLKK